MNSIVSGIEFWGSWGILLKTYRVRLQHLLSSEDVSSHGLGLQSLVWGGLGFRVLCCIMNLVVQTGSHLESYHQV